MAGRAFKGWGLFLHGFNRGFNPNALTSGMERGFAKKQRDDDVARAGAWRAEDIGRAERHRKEDIRRHGEAQTVANNRAAFGVLTPDEQLEAMARGERPETFRGDADVLRGVATARRNAREAAAAAAAEAAKQKRQDDLKKAEIAVGPARRQATLATRRALGEELVRITNGDPEAISRLRQQNPRRYREAILPGPQRGAGGAVQHPVDLGRSAQLQGWMSRLEMLGLQSGSEQYPIVKQVLSHYRSNSPRPLIVGPDIQQQIDALSQRSPEAADALSFVLEELAKQNRAILQGSP